MRLRELMSPSVVTVGPTEPANEAWSRMRRERIRHLVVTENKRIVGILSERDLGGRGGAGLRKGHTVRELMTPGVTSASPEMTLRQAANLMRGQLIGSLPIVDGDRLVGIVTATDVLDELGRGSTRPKIHTERPSLRLPAGIRPALRTRSLKDGPIPDSAKRAPFPGELPRPFKREAGRAEAPLVPANVRVQGIELDDKTRTYIRRKLGMKLGKFAPSVERVSVRVEDVNGPRGGIDKACRIKAVLSGLPSVLHETRKASLDAAIEGALDGIERAVRSSLRRRRMKPVRAELAQASKRRQAVS